MSAVRTFLTLLRWELAKVTRRKSSYLGFALCVAFCAVVMLVFAYSQFRALRETARGIVDNPLEHVNGFFFATFVLYFGDKALLPLLAIVVPGSQIAGEARDGTLRVLLTRPPSRPMVYLVKLLVSQVWLLATVFFLLAFALVAGLITMGGGDFLVFIWEFRHFGPWLAGQGDWVWIFLVAGVGVSLSLFMFMALAMALSTVTDSPVVAHLGALGSFFVSSIVQRIPEQLVHPRVRDMMPTSHMGFWHELYWLFSPTPERFNEHRFWGDVTWCATCSAVFVVAGLVIFTVKDVKS
jgi:ABC-type transport system involved in multi-copper enzyme maturation permease subunit